MHLDNHKHYNSVPVWCIRTQYIDFLCLFRKQFQLVEESCFGGSPLVLFSYVHIVMLWDKLSKKPGVRFLAQLKQDQHTTATPFQNQCRNGPAKAWNIFSRPHHTVAQNNEILVTHANQLVPSRQIIGRILCCSYATLVGL